MELEGEFGIVPELIQSSGGVFEIEVGRELIFSKLESGRFPYEGEIQELIQTKM